MNNKGVSFFWLTLYSILQSLGSKALYQYYMLLETICANSSKFGVMCIPLKTRQKSVEYPDIITGFKR
jgi:hypothetical protein